MTLRKRCCLTGVLAGLLGQFCLPIAGRAAITYDLSLGTSVLETDNLHLDPEPEAPGQPEPVRETIFAVIPKLRLEWREGQDLLLAKYRGEYWTFSGDEDRDPLWLHELSASLGWRRWAPAFLEASAQRERVPRSLTRDDEGVVDQIDRTWLLVRTGLAWEMRGTGALEIAYQGDFESFDGGTGYDEQAVRQYGEGTWRHRWGPLWESEAGLKYGHVSQDVGLDSNELRVFASIAHRLSERLTARTRLEWLRIDAAGGEGDAGSGQASYPWDKLLKSAELQGQEERGGSWALAYEDRIVLQPDGDLLVTGRVQADSLLRDRRGSEMGIRMWYDTNEYRVSGTHEEAWGSVLRERLTIASAVAFELAGRYTWSQVREVGEPEVETHSVTAGGALIALLGRRLLAEAGYVYQSDDSTDAQQSFVVNRWYGVLTYYFKNQPGSALPASSLMRLVVSSEGLSAGR